MCPFEKELVPTRDLLAPVLEQNRKDWLRYLVRILTNIADAEDVLQEAVERVLSRNRLFPSEEELRMYLGRAICNTAIEFYHWRKRERRRLVSLRDQLFESSLADPCALLLQQESKELEVRRMSVVQEGLRQLPLKQYEALRLTLMDPGDRSIRKAGATKGIPYSTLRHRRREGLRHLRRWVHKKQKVELQTVRSA